MLLIHSALKLRHASALLLALSVLLMSIISSSVYALEQVGTVAFARGTIAAHAEGEKESRILGKSSEIFEGDNIQTSDRSFVIIRFKDKTRITIRPNSSFSVTQFGQQAGESTAKFELHKGGIRTTNGDISKSKPRDFQIKTPDTIISAQQADFSVRVCQKEECQQQEDKHKKTPDAEKSDVIARIVKVRGLVTAVNANILSEDERLLTVGAPLYSADVIKSERDGYAVLVFKDKGRITVESNSKFAIKEYSFDQVKQEGRSLYDLFLGGVRILTGAIGKKNRADYQANTTVATIGIRGTGYDLLDRGEGLYSTTWQGTITQNNNAGEFELAAPDSNYIKDRDSKPTSGKPEKEQIAPRPDTVIVEDEPGLFVENPLDRTLSGTYVDVHDGHIQVGREGKKPINLGRDESSYTDPKGKTDRTKEPPEIMKQDPYPLPTADFNEDDFSVLTDDIDVHSTDEVYQCECK